MDALNRYLHRALNAVSAGLAVVVAFWDSPALDDRPAAGRPVPTAVLFASDLTRSHLTRNSDGVVHGTLCGPWGHIAAEPTEFERLADEAALLASIIRFHREHATSEGTPQP
ncbi:hypothetical protein ACIF6L_34895 [Kitasatospora sp. NPDC086009]|uniref:hypothetical protein n=1 Tax=unclassified Kitasatospora TaxID=2633591 RepID=UPI0037C5357E